MGEDGGPHLGLTIGALYGAQVELLILVIAADVSLLLQLFGGVIDVLLGYLVRNHFCVGGSNQIPLFQQSGLNNEPLSGTIQPGQSPSQLQEPGTQWTSGGEG